MKVEFRVLQTPDINQMLEVLIDTVIKEYDECKTIAILAPTGIAKQLDDDLWQDGQDSFIPHHCAIAAREYNQYKNIPILITDNLFITSGYDVLINIMEVAVDPQRVKIKELKEFVYQEDRALQASRKKYVYYKNSNLEITTTKDS
ncbi:MULTISPECIES: DNA polymerase III subunit chi [Francisella]|uniref:DNA polymerase III chi subunit, HolC family protein n=4 Tax=Francisella TaxID=262 RepID=A0AAW3DAF6_9GAMM|nr:MULTISPECIES: DNA polymerase III subunit chi [Francisella]AEI35129.1 DNA polymerase III (CHI subunit) protein [Francisella salina]AJI47502.1 DNA polymerase III chi subunit, HolC family protein [Francisella philomiragia]AJI49340.1 DNA polymerase III chi subunit, HolC family protein [Francisella philomiragia]KFJ42488.1 DNA polymerase III chi subunit, HolC family protein [Francisella philomiragia]MBK2021443.1 DNA polymerase III subunit chi [Francisella philomiragia]